MSEEEFIRIREREGDKYEFTYDGYQCFISRHSSILTLNGYFIIPSIVIEGISISFDFLIVHGGVTYDQFVTKGNPYLASIKMLNIGDYIVGFDTAHAGDYTPFVSAGFIDNNIYRDKNYVIDEIKSMIDQMNDIYPEFNLQKLRDESIDDLIN